MLNYISKHSPIFLMLAATLGFAIPSASALIFPFLPYILFFLMLFTLIGMKQNELIKMLGLLDIWLYASFHAVAVTAEMASNNDGDAPNNPAIEQANTESPTA